MGLFDFIGDILGLSPPSTGEAMSKEDIAWLMDQALTNNRTDQQGLFTGFNWSQGGDGRWTQTQTLNDALLPAVQQLVGRASGEPNTYDSGFGGLIDAYMQNRQHQYPSAGSGASQRPPYQPPESIAPLYQPPQEPPTNHQRPPWMGGGGGGWGPVNPPRYDPK